MKRLAVIRNYFDRKPQGGLYLGTLMHIISHWLYGSAFALFWAEKIYGHANILILPLIISWVMILMEFPRGVLADKFGRMKVYGLGLIISAMGIAFFVFGDAMRYFILGAILIGTGESQMDTSLTAWFFDKLSGNANRDSLKYFARSSGITSLVSAGLGIFFAGMVKGEFAWIVMLSAGVVKILGGLLLITILRDNRRYVTESIITLVSRSVNCFLKTSKLIKLVGLLLINYSIYAIFLSFWRDKGYALGLEPGFNYDGLFYGWVGIGGLVLGSLVASKGISKIKAVITIWILHLVGALLVLHSESIIIFNAGFFLFGVGYGGFFPIYRGWIHSLVPSTIRGSVVSLFSGINMMGVMLIRYLISGLVGNYTSIGIGGLVTIAMIITLSLKTRSNLNLPERLSGRG